MARRRRPRRVASPVRRASSCRRRGDGRLRAWVSGCRSRISRPSTPARSRARGDRSHHRRPLPPRPGHPRRAARNRPRPLGGDDARRGRAPVRLRVAAWEADPFTFAPAGGESGVAVLARSLPVVREIVAAHQGEQVLVVSHKATLRLVLSSLLGFDPRGYRDRLDQSPACLNVVDFRIRCGSGSCCSTTRRTTPTGPASRIRACRNGGTGRSGHDER